MPVELPNLARTALVIGCGYLGRRLGRMLRDRGCNVMGTTRSRMHAKELASMDIRPLLLSVTERATFASLTPALDADALDVYYMIPPGRGSRNDSGPTPRQTVLGGIAYTINALKTAKKLRRAVLVSSTAVYGQTGGERVDADSFASPQTERAGLLRDGEELWLNSGLPTFVVRLAGIYGPGRVVGMAALRDGAPLVGDPRNLLNLIHVDDAAMLLLHVMNAASPGRIELGCDGHPVPRIEYYTELAHRLGVAPPEVVEDPAALEKLGLNVERLQRTSSKACDNILTCKRTGWTPMHANFRQGLDAVMESGVGTKN
jgi:nucleoside-diphosphate-sugar epimerase